jgi:putative SOS response-associated peptidase YedK
VPVIRERADRDTGEVRRIVEPAIWDFRPSFVKEPKRPQFNARLETVATNGMWKGAFASGRCIVPMRGYYEWTGEAGAKQPWFLHGEGALLAAAGVMTYRKVDDEWEVSTAIITRAARDASGEVHDRMPAFLTADAWDRWLDPHKLESDADKEGMLDLLRGVSDGVAGTVRAHEVDRRVNSSQKVDPADATLIEPLAS